MKKLFLALSIMLSCVAFAAEEERAMYIYNANGYIFSYPIAMIDSVMFEAPETGINLAPHQLSVHKDDYALLEAQAIGFNPFVWDGLNGGYAKTKWTVGNDSIIQLKEITPSSYAMSACQILGLRVGTTTITAQFSDYTQTIEVEVLPMWASDHVSESLPYYWEEITSRFNASIADHWSYWGISEITTDECIIPTRYPGGHWTDKGIWRDLHTHNAPAASESFYNMLSYGILECNRLIDIIRYSALSDTEKENNILQLEAIRCFYGYMMLDCFGSFPFEDSEYVPGQNGKTQSAQEIWSKLVACLERIAPQLPKVTNANRLQYVGQATQGFAYALLARLYLNAESFGCTVNGTNFYTEAVRYCDKIIQSGSYSIEDNYFTNFKIQNETSRENIFVLLEDGSPEMARWYESAMMNKSRLQFVTLPYAMQEVWNMLETPWNGACATKSFINRFEYGRDVRGLCDTIQGSDGCDGHGWLAGPVKNNGVVVRDANWEDVILTTNVSSIENARWSDGARMIKYEVDKTGTYRYMENDFVVFRYADILYMKAEAILRGGTGNLNQLLQDSSFRKIRQRAGVDYYTSLTLDELLNERGREFYWECVRRRDLIRFGKYNDPTYIDYLENTESGNELSPLPLLALAADIHADGTYIVMEGKRNEEQLMGMTNAINEWTGSPREGFYEKYIYLHATDKFYIAQVTNGNKTVYGGTLSATSLETDNYPVDGYKGVMSGTKSMHVNEDGLYHVIYDKTTAIIIVAPVVWGISGSHNSWGWSTEYTEMHASANNDTIEWTWTDVLFRSSGLFAFKNNNVWKIIVNDEDNLRIPTCLNENMESNGSNISINQAGYYTIKLKYHLASGKLSNTYSYEVIFNREYAGTDYSNVELELVGSGIADQTGATPDDIWNWGNKLSMGTPTKNGDNYIWQKEHVLLTAGGEFKARYTNMGEGDIDSFDIGMYGLWGNNAYVETAGAYTITVTVNCKTENGNMEVVAE